MPAFGGSGREAPKEEVRVWMIGHQSMKGRRRQPAKVARGPNVESLPLLGLISLRNWMGCAEHGYSGKHEQTYYLLHRDAAVERHHVFSVTPRRLRA